MGKGGNTENGQVGSGQGEDSQEYDIDRRDKQTEETEQTSE